MKKYTKLIIYLVTGTISCTLLLFFISKLAKGILIYESPALLAAHERSEITRLRFRDTLDPYILVTEYFLFFAAAVGGVKIATDRSRVYQARIKDSIIPVDRADLHQMTPILTGLVNAVEMEAANAGRDAGQNEVLEIYKQVASLHDTYYRTLKKSLKNDVLPEIEQKALPLATPSFADLIQSEELASGKPLILGYDLDGKPQYRTLQNLKALAVAGWQGSGKTLSTAYIIASSVLCYGAEVHVIDPHKEHDEGLFSKIEPLAKAGLINVVNPFHTASLINQLDRTLDRRLNGVEDSTRPILLVIDELARLAKSTAFDKLIAFLERCTQETRKSNITFIGCSQKWTARHFRGRADIRGCMNSALIHKTKPSQANLLLEDTQDRKLVKELKTPGSAILMTDYAGPDVVQIPYCCAQDMQQVVKKVGNGASITIYNEPGTSVKPAGTSREPVNAIPELHIVKKITEEPDESIIERLNRTCEVREQGTSKNQWFLALSADVGLSASYLKNLLLGNKPLTLETERKLSQWLET